MFFQSVLSQNGQRMCFQTVLALLYKHSGSHVFLFFYFLKPTITATALTGGKAFKDVKSFTLKLIPLYTESRVSDTLSFMTRLLKDFSVLYQAL